MSKMMLMLLPVLGLPQEEKADPAEDISGDVDEPAYEQDIGDDTNYDAHQVAESAEPETAIAEGNDEETQPTDVFVPEADDQND
jgi:hypothetical protein